MRGQQERSSSLFSYVSIEERIPTSHPLRRIRRLADQALDQLEIGCSRIGFGPREGAISPRQTNAKSSGHGASEAVLDALSWWHGAINTSASQECGGCP